MSGSIENAAEPGTLYVVSAPSGAGKTSLSRAAVGRLAALRHAAAISVSYTTRPPRPGERDGEHYHFVEAAAFERMVKAGEFLEHAEVFGQRYGTGRAQTERLLAAGSDVILDIDWQGGRQVRARVPAAVGIFILPPSAAELERRLRGRGQDSDETIRRRMAAARAEMSHYDEYDYLIVNESFERAADGMVAILRTRRLDRARQAARHAALIKALLTADPPIR